MDRHAAALASHRCWKRLAARIELDMARNPGMRPDALDQWEAVDRQRSNAQERARRA